MWRQVLKKTSKAKEYFKKKIFFFNFEWLTLAVQQRYTCEGYYKESGLFLFLRTLSSPIQSRISAFLSSSAERFIIPSQCLISFYQVCGIHCNRLWQQFIRQAYNGTCYHYLYFTRMNLEEMQNKKANHGQIES